MVIPNIVIQLNNFDIFYNFVFFSNLSSAHACHVVVSVKVLYIQHNIHKDEQILHLYAKQSMCLLTTLF